MNPLLFTDPAFLFFFVPLALTGYWITPAKWRNGFLLVASFLLYIWGEGRYAGVLAASMLINVGAGIAIDRGAYRRLAVVVGVTLNLAVLAVFKYTDFFVENIERLGWTRIAPPHLHLPIGLSFYAFMGISYLVDLYRRDLDKAPSAGRVSLFMAMFPHLIAGPIVRMTEFAPQFEKRSTDLDRISSGVRRFVIGFGKKMLIANTVAIPADAIFGLKSGEVPTSLAWLGLLCYTLQIYYDFSGYSDMAIGLARMLGFEFPENFNYPYISQSITEFWRRWHITLSSWLRDYVFFPLGGVRRGRWYVVRNQLIVFLLCGLWHGAAWHFVVWGLWHGLFLGIEQLGSGKLLRAVPAPVRAAYALMAVSFGWVLFRCATVADAYGFARALLGFEGTLPANWIAVDVINPTTVLGIVAGVAGAVPLKGMFVGLPVQPRFAGALEFAALASVFVCAVAVAASSTYNPFIYFRF